MFKGKRLSPALVTIVLVCAVIASLSAQTMDDLGEHPVRFAIIGDRTGGHTPGIYGEIVSEVAALRPDFVMTVGDMIEGYTSDTTELSTEWQEYMELVTPIQVPIHYTPGNHDITWDAMLEKFKEYVGEPYYSFDHRGIHFVVLDNSRWENSDEMPQEQLDWMAADLKDHADALYTIVFHHKPFWLGSLARGRADKLYSIMADNGVDAVFTGHFHRYFTGTFDGITYTSIGSSGGDSDSGWDEFDYHYAWVTVDDEGIHTAPIMINSVQPWDAFTTEDLFATNRMMHEAIWFNTPAMISEDMSVPLQEIEITVSNFDGDDIIEDTARWDVPEGWTVDPVTYPVMVEPGQSVSFKVAVAGSADASEVPTLSLHFPYNSRSPHEVTEYLRLAQSTVCRKISDKPTIDGQLNESIWQNASAELTDTDDDSLMVAPAQFCFAYDNDNLYLAAHCTEPHMENLVADAAERDGTVYSDDCVGFFLQPDVEVPTVYQIYFNPNGTIFDQKIIWDDNWYYDTERKWNAECDVKTAKGDDYWTMEARIPLEQLGVEGKADQDWGINFRRKQKSLGENLDWQPISYDPKYFGLLILK